MLFKVDRSACFFIFTLLFLGGCKSETPASSGSAAAAPAPVAPVSDIVVATSASPSPEPSASASASPSPEPSASASSSVGFSSVVGLYGASGFCRVLSTGVTPVPSLAVTIPFTKLFGSTLYEGKTVEFKKDGSYAYFTAVFSDSNCSQLVMKYQDDQTGTFEDTIGALDVGATDQRVVKFTAPGIAAVYLKVLQSADLSLKLPSPIESIPAGTSAAAPFLTAEPWIYKKILADADHRTLDMAALKSALASDSIDYQVPCMHSKTVFFTGKQYGFESAVRFYANSTITQDSYLRDTLFNTLEACLYVGGESDRVQRNLMSGTYSIEALGAVPGATVYVGLVKITMDQGKFGLTNNPAASTYVSKLNLYHTCDATNWSTAPNANPKDCNGDLIGLVGATRSDTYLFTFDITTKELKISKFNTFTIAEYAKASGGTPASYGFKIIDDVTLTQPSVP